MATRNGGDRVVQHEGVVESCGRESEAHGKTTEGRSRAALIGEAESAAVLPRDPGALVGRSGRDQRRDRRGGEKSVRRPAVPFL
jgi:hypothetical protein